MHNKLIYEISEMVTEQKAAYSLLPSTYFIFDGIFTIFFSRFDLLTLQMSHWTLSLLAQMLT